MGSFEILEHTGEIGVLATAGTAAGAFAHAARGMFSFMVNLDAVEELEERWVEVEAPDLEALLVAWLDELIYLFEVDALVLHSFDIHEMGTTRLKALCRGERLDTERHRFSIAPKAATYHMLEVKEDPDSSTWRAQIILDI